MPPKKGYCFTLNNYDDESLAHIRATLSSDCVYGIVGREVGENGTPHLQGYAMFTRSLGFKTIQSRLDPRCHLEVAAGSPESNRRYCSKDGCFDEYGEIPNSNSSSKPEGKITRDELFSEFTTLLGEGRSSARRGLAEFAKRRPGTFGFSGNVLLRNYLSVQPAEHRPDIIVKWYWGSPGTGKSRSAHEQMPSAFVKEPKSKWWNGYLLERDVIIDDYGLQCIDINHLLRWFDRYPCYVESKGGMLPLIADSFIITSNFHPSQLFKSTVFRFEGGASASVEDAHPQLPALMRRIELLEFN